MLPVEWPEVMSSQSRSPQELDMMILEAWKLMELFSELRMMVMMSPCQRQRGAPEKEEGVA